MGFNYKAFMKEMKAYQDNPFDWSERYAKKKTVKVRLAEKIEQLFGGGSYCDPKQLQSNHGYNNAKWDCCNWSGYVTKPNGVRIGICSWQTMTSLANKKEPLTVSNEDDNINEID